jgi:membrane fusion protein (multidrug efflux system)
MKTKNKMWIAVVFGLLIIVGALVGIKVSQIRAMIAAGKSFAMPPESVTSVKVEATSWESTRAAIGSVVAIHDVSLGAELPGVIREVNFDSGTLVKRGAVLVKLDTSNEAAQLASASADATLAKASIERAHVLRAGGANTPADLDAADARSKQSLATVGNLHATIAKKTIRAPFDGRIAIRQVERGQVVSPGTPIATIQSIDPIYAEFSLPQQALSDLKIGQATSMRSDSFPGASWTGTITTINSEVDVATRSVRIRATFPNKDGRLRPGLFVNVEVHAAEKRPVLIIPATAVIYAPYGDSVFVLDDKGQGAPNAAGKPAAAPAPGGPAGGPHLVARQKFVRLGDHRGDFVVVVSGLSAGDTVVGNGAFKLRNGSGVVVHNDLAPKVELDPQPADK